METSNPTQPGPGTTQPASLDALEHDLSTFFSELIIVGGPETVRLDPAYELQVTQTEGPGAEQCQGQSDVYPPPEEVPDSKRPSFLGNSACYAASNCSLSFSQQVNLQPRPSPGVDVYLDNNKRAFVGRYTDPESPVSVKKNAYTGEEEEVVLMETQKFFKIGAGWKPQTTMAGINMAASAGGCSLNASTNLVGVPGGLDLEQGGAAAEGCDIPFEGCTPQAQQTLKLPIPSISEEIEAQGQVGFPNTNDGSLNQNLQSSDLNHSQLNQSCQGLLNQTHLSCLSHEQQSAYSSAHSKAVSHRLQAFLQSRYEALQKRKREALEAANSISGADPASKVQLYDHERVDLERLVADLRRKREEADAAIRERMASIRRGGETTERAGE